MTEMSLFGDLDLESAPDDPNFLPDNTYEAFLTDMKVGPTKNGDKRGATFQYSIDGGVHNGRKVTEWIQVPTPDMSEEDKTRANSFLKRRLLSLGVPAERMREVEAADLIGKHVLITTRNKGEFVNITKVTLADMAGETSSDTFGI